MSCLQPTSASKCHTSSTLPKCILPCQLAQVALYSKKKHVEGDTGPVTRPPDPTGAPMIILGHVRALAGCCEVGNEWE